MTVPKTKSAAAVLPLSVTFLRQAETCREQARDAVRLKRYKAAMGLFATAAALCRSDAVVHEVDEKIRAMAADCLRQIDSEMSAYRELARSLERPHSIRRTL